MNINERLLILSHEIREIEHDLKIARRRRRWSNVALVFGPVLGLALYSMGWLPWISSTVLAAIYIPAIPIAISFVIATIWFKRNPGGPNRLVEVDSTEPGTSKFQKYRMTEGELELELARKRDTRQIVLASNDIPTKVRRVTYKEDAYSDIDSFRLESKRYRRGNNVLQGIVIIGSLAATGASGIAAQLISIRWVTLA